MIGRMKRAAPLLPRHTSRRITLAFARCAPLAGLLLHSGHAAAQEADDRPDAPDTVLSRARPGFEPVGIAFGAFRLFPSVGMGLSATDNVYATGRAKSGDAALALTGQARLRSQWRRHRLDVGIEGSMDRYATRQTENVERFAADAQVHLDIDRDSRIAIQALAARRIEPRGASGDTLLAAAPVYYRETGLGLSVERDFGPTRLTVQGRVDGFRYADRRTGAATVDLSDRDYDSLSGNVRLLRGFGPGLAVFASVGLNRARYANDPAALNRDSHGYTALGGVAFGVNRLLRGEVGAGYLRQSFADPAFPDVSGVAYRASLEWSPTRLVTVGARADRTIQRSPLVSVAGIEQQDMALSVDYEWRRNVIVQPSVSYALLRFKGIDRTDRYLTVGAKVTWLIDRRMSLVAQAIHAQARPSGTAPGGRLFDQNRASVAVSFRL